jgi:hypothetical protein
LGRRCGLRELRDDLRLDDVPRGRSRDEPCFAEDLDHVGREGGERTATPLLRRKPEVPSLVAERHLGEAPEVIDHGRKVGAPLGGGGEHDPLFAHHAPRGEPSVGVDALEREEPPVGERAHRGLLRRKKASRRHGHVRHEPRRLDRRQERFAVDPLEERIRQIRRTLWFFVTLDDTHLAVGDADGLEAEERDERPRCATISRGKHEGHVGAGRGNPWCPRERDDTLGALGETDDEERLGLERAQALGGRHEVGEREDHHVGPVGVGAPVNEASLELLRRRHRGELEVERRAGISPRVPRAVRGLFEHGGRRGEHVPERRDTQRSVEHPRRRRGERRVARIARDGHDGRVDDGAARIRRRSRVGRRVGFAFVLDHDERCLVPGLRSSDREGHEADERATEEERDGATHHGVPFGAAASADEPIDGAAGGTSERSSRNVGVTPPR